MTTRQELLNQWQERLTEAEQACLAAESPAWSDRVRVKLYRFLLTMYGRTNWPGPKNDVDNSLRRSTASQVTIAEPKNELAGKEPRTRAEILRGLQNVKGLGEELAPAGPLQAGLLPDSPMVVASYKRRPAAEIAVDCLRRAGLAPVISQQGKMWQIYVAAENYAAATRSLRGRERFAPAIERRREERAVRASSLGLAVTMAMASCLMAGLFVRAAIFGYPEHPDAPLANPTLLSVQGCVVALMFAMTYALFRSWVRGQRHPARRRVADEPAPGSDFR